MNINPSDLIIQTAAAVIGGIILFLLGLILSALSKQTQAYMHVVTKSWRLWIVFLILIYLTSNLFILTKSVNIAILPMLFALAMYLLVIYMNNSIEEKAAKLFTSQKNSIDRLKADHINATEQLKADLVLITVRYWQLREIEENALAYCYQALSMAPDNYHDFYTVLGIIEELLNKIKTNEQKLTTFRQNELHKVLKRVPDQYEAQVKRILRLVDSLA
jgi:hypothetical protein